MPEHAKIIGHLVIDKKQCKDCKEWKSIGYFHLAGKRKDGLGYKYQPYCKICDNKRSKVWTENNREKDRQNSRRKRLKYKFNRPGYKKRQSNRAMTLYHSGYLKLTKLQKENMIFRELIKLEKVLSPEEVRNIAELISIGALESASKIVFSKSIKE